MVVSCHGIAQSLFPSPLGRILAHTSRGRCAPHPDPPPHVWGGGKGVRPGRWACLAAPLGTQSGDTSPHSIILPVSGLAHGQTRPAPERGGWWACLPAPRGSQSGDTSPHSIILPVSGLAQGETRPAPERGGLWSAVRRHRFQCQRSGKTGEAFHSQGHARKMQAKTSPWGEGRVRVLEGSVSQSEATAPGRRGSPRGRRPARSRAR